MMATPHSTFRTHFDTELLVELDDWAKATGRTRRAALEIAARRLLLDAPAIGTALAAGPAVTSTAHPETSKERVERESRAAHARDVEAGAKDGSTRARRELEASQREVQPIEKRGKR